MREILADKLLGGPSGLRGPLEALGPVFIKAGQFLAVRPDLIPRTYCDELMLLFDHVPAAPWSEMQKVILQELGRPPEKLFTKFSPEPIASGSLGQTYRAILKDQTAVAVKILRPDIKERIARDLRKFRFWARLLELGGWSFPVSLKELTAELSHWLEQEIDYGHELKNLERLYDLCRDNPYARVPRPFPELSTARVLTAEFLEGVPVSRLYRSRSSKFGEAISKPSTLLEPQQFARNLLMAVLQQIFEFQFFHADPHPGNLIILPDNLVGFVDFGLCDHLDSQFRDRHIRYFRALYEGDDEQVVRTFEEILTSGIHSDSAAFRLAFLGELRRWRDRRAEAAGLGSEDISRARRSSVAEIMTVALELARRHRLEIPGRVLSMYRALLTAVTIAHQLGQENELRKAARDYFEDIRRREAVNLISTKRLEETCVGMVQLLQLAPERIYELLSELADGRLVFHVSNSESPSETRNRNRRVRLLVTALASVSVALLLTIPRLPLFFGIQSKLLLSGLLAFLYASCLVQWLRIK